jgi:hypothetical protein
MDEEVRPAGSKTGPEPREVGPERREAVGVFQARPMRGAINYKAIRDRIHERFSKTLAYSLNEGEPFSSSTAVCWKAPSRVRPIAIIWRRT